MKLVLHTNVEVTVCVEKKEESNTRQKGKRRHIWVVLEQFQPHDTRGLGCVTYDFLFSEMAL